MFWLVNSALVGAATQVDISFGLYSDEFGLGVVSGLLVLPLVLPMIAVTVRRLHDSDLSGGWYFIALIPFVGWIIQLIQLARRGTRGPNRYGADPLGEIVVEVPNDGGAPFASRRGRFTLCPWCQQSNPQGSTTCQWCRKDFREPQGPA
jgi:hypothetical protein